MRGWRHRHARLARPRPWTTCRSWPNRPAPRRPPTPRTCSPSCSAATAAGPVSTRTWRPRWRRAVFRWWGSTRSGTSGSRARRKRVRATWRGSCATTAPHGSGRACCWSAIRSAPTCCPFCIPACRPMRARRCAASPWSVRAGRRTSNSMSPTGSTRKPDRACRSGPRSRAWAMSMSCASMVPRSWSRPVPGWRDRA